VIGRLFAWWREQRIEHHARRASLFGAATLAAQIRRDWPAAARFMSQMHAAQAARDALLAARPVQRIHPITWGLAVPALVLGVWTAFVFFLTT
jgi:hypothetical protein